MPAAQTFSYATGTTGTITLSSNGGSFGVTNGLTLNSSHNIGVNYTSNCTGTTQGLTFNGSGTWGCNSYSLAMRTAAEASSSAYSILNSQIVFGVGDTETTTTADGLSVSRTNNIVRYAVNLTNGRGLTISEGSVSLPACSTTGYVLKWDGSAYSCQKDDGTKPTCEAEDYLNWDGSNFECKSFQEVSVPVASKIYIPAGVTIPAGGILWICLGANGSPIHDNYYGGATPNVSTYKVDDVSTISGATCTASQSGIGIVNSTGVAIITSDNSTPSGTGIWRITLMDTVSYPSGTSPCGNGSNICIDSSRYFIAL
jgi:hypothetical protein